MELPSIIDIERGTMIVRHKSGNPADAIGIVVNDIKKKFFSPGESPFARYGKNHYSEYVLRYAGLIYKSNNRGENYYEHTVVCEFG